MKSNFALRRSKLTWLADHRELWEHRPLHEALEGVALRMKQAGLYSPATKEADILPGLRKLLKQALDAKTGEVRKEVTTLRPPCPHHNWAVRDYVKFGFGICLDCRRELPLPELLTALQERVEQAAATYRALELSRARTPLGLRIMLEARQWPRADAALPGLPAPAAP